MARPAPVRTSVPARYTARRYLLLVDEGVLGPDDRVELLEGVIVAMAPHSPRHAAGIRLASEALFMFRDPVPARRRYRTKLVAHRGERIDLATAPGVSVAVDDLLPSPRD